MDMSEEAFLATDQLYYLTAAALLAVGIGVFILARRLEGMGRRMVTITTIPAFAMGLSYLMLAPLLPSFTVSIGTEEHDLSRFLAYTVLLVIVPYAMKCLVALSWRQYRLITIPLLFIPWMALVSWYLSGLLEAVFNILAVISYFVAVYVMYGPIARHSRMAGGKPHLLYLKIVNLAVLSWGVLLVTAVLSQAAAGLLDGFIGQFVASYVDVLFVAGFIALVHTNHFLFGEQRPGDQVDGVDAASRSELDAPDGDLALSQQDQT